MYGHGPKVLYKLVYKLKSTFGDTECSVETFRRD